ncbi:LuxR family transcriptional regulator [Pseudomonas sp. v388]|uniref:response regulator transcription factor n=1 Tax=Pseudomonas sp. v388 TaxID=2479849 RepID=UPI000F784DD2|nr:helix-turn-helix transcriptional regulator [Pseudomonas sp. v388]RRV10499.1 LuxR family transcriptional regulator [Pseudomonas sp. v388]
MFDTRRLSISCEDYARKTVSFLKHSTGSSAVVFTWWEDHSEFPPTIQLGGDSRKIREYYCDYQRSDPMRAERLAALGKTFETLSEASEQHDEELLEQYQPHLHKYGVIEEIDFIFWAGGKAVASAALVQTQDTSTSLGIIALKEMQGYLQYGFSLLPAVKMRDREQRLRDRYKLTPKEIAVAELLVLGESNKSIASLMDVELATVKTHLIHLFQKLEVQSRSKAVSLLNA